MKRHIKKVTNVFSWVVIALVATLFAKTLKDNWDNLEGISLRPDIFVILSLVCFVVSIVLSGVAWGKIVDRLTGKRIPIKEAVQIHLASWLLKYVPGQAGSFLNKIAWAKKRKIDGKKITASFIYENVFLLLASTVPTIPILAVAMSEKFTEDVGLFVPLLLSIPLVVLVMTPRVFELILNLIFRILKKQQLSRSELLGTKDNAKFIIEFIVPRIANGAAFVFLAISMVGIEPSQYLVFGAIYVLAGIIGVLAIFVPSGLGVREAVISLFASAYIPVEQAITLAILARFYTTVADVVIAGLYVFLKSGKGSKS